MIRAELDDIQRLGRRFWIQVESGIMVRGIWKVRDNNGLYYAAKPFRRGVSALQMAVSVQETVKIRDPELLPELASSDQGRPFVYDKGTPILWMKWINGRIMDYFYPGDRLRAIKTIIRWQEAVRGARIPLVLRHWGGWESVLMERIEELRRCKKMASERDTCFSRVYQNWWDFFYSQANLALEWIGCKDSRDSTVESERRGEICHCDWAHHNLILRPGGFVSVLDLEYLQGNCASLDYVDLLNRFLLLDGGRPTVIPVFLNWIHRLKPLNLEDKKLFRALLFWPDAFWMAGRQVFIEQLHHSEQFNLEKFRRKVPSPDIWRAWQRMIDDSLWD